MEVINGMSEGTPSSPPILLALATSLVSTPLFLSNSYNEL